MTSAAPSSCVEEEDLGARAFYDDVRGRLIVDAHRSVRAANAAATDMLTRRRGVAVRQGALAAVDVRDEAAIARMLTALGRGEVRRLVLRAEDGELITLRAAAMGEDGVVLIELEPVAPPSANTLPTLAHVYGLTRAEAQVLDLLALGLAPEQAARRLGMAEGTSRTHAKHIYAKLDVSTRGELMALLYSLK